MNDWLVAEHQKRYNAPPDFFTAGGFAAASAALTAIEKAGGTDTEKLIAAMEGMTFETPKGPMTFRKEDHQALQVMYHFKVKAERQGRPTICSNSSTPSRPTRCRSPCATSADGRRRAATVSTPTTEPALETRGLTVRFGGHVAVDDVSCRFAPGTLTAIVGPNGAGKTTYFNLISGQLQASAGSGPRRRAGRHGLSASARTRRGLGRAFQLTNLFPQLTALENVGSPCRAARMRAGHVSRSGTPARPHRKGRGGPRAVRLSDKRDVAPEALSHGDQRKLEVALLIAWSRKSSCSTSRQPA